LKAAATACAIFAVFAILTFSIPVRADAQADIKALEDRFVAAFKAKDLDAIMKVYAPGQTVVAFDVVPPRNMWALAPTARTGRAFSTASAARSPSR
jgi:hypothetical protein